MARFSGTTWTNTEANDWAAGGLFRVNKFQQQVGQNLEWLAQNHSHDGTAGGGAVIPTADPKYMWFYTPAAGAAFA